jgi:hypothetical protein
MQSECFLLPDLSMYSPLSDGLLSLFSQTSSPESPSCQPLVNRSSKGISSKSSSQKRRRWFDLHFQSVCCDLVGSIPTCWNLRRPLILTCLRLL